MLQYRYFSISDILNLINITNTFIINFLYFKLIIKIVINIKNLATFLMDCYFKRYLIWLEPI